MTPEPRRPRSPELRHPYADSVSSVGLPDRAHGREFWYPLLKRGVIGAAVFGGCMVGVYAKDVGRGIIRQERERGSISMVLPAANEAAEQTIVYAFPGLSGLDAKSDAAYMKAYTDIGAVAAVRYAKTLDYDQLAQSIIDHARAHGVSTIALSGDSMGGIVEIAVARRIYELAPDITISFILLNCSPMGLSTVRPEKLDLVDYALAVAAVVPGAEHSTYISFAGQQLGRMYSNLDRTLDMTAGELLLDAGSTYRSAASPNKASAALIKSEFNAIVGSHVAEDMAALTQLGEGRQPLYLYVRPDDPNRDSTVLVEAAVEKLQQFAAEAGATVAVVKAAEIQHANWGWPNEHAMNNAATTALKVLADYRAAQLRDARRAVIAGAMSSPGPDGTVSVTRKPVVEAAPRPPGSTSSQTPTTSGQPRPR